MGNHLFPAWVSGAIYEPGQPALPVEDAGVMLGLSVFDSLLWERGVVLFFELHMERFRNGIEQLGIAWPLPWDPRVAVDELVAEIGRRVDMPERLVIRLTATRGLPGGGPNLAVTVRVCEQLPAGGVSVALAGEFKALGDRCEAIKSTNRLRNVLAREAGRELGAWEVLFATTEGDLSEGTITNLFAVVGGVDGPRLMTPSIDRGCLGGIVRNLIIADLQREPLCIDGSSIVLEVDRISRGQLEAATELFLTNTTQGVIPVSRVLGSSVRYQGLQGPVARAVADRIENLERSYRNEGPLF